jgi:hypothetical protein
MGFAYSDTLSGVDLQTATITGYNAYPSLPVLYYETDVITSVTPIPEPGNLSFFGAGLLGIALMLRPSRFGGERRRSSKSAIE